MNDSITEIETQPVYIAGRKAAVLRNGGALCDIRRHSNGFLYNPHRVAISEELLESLPDPVVLQFTNLDSGDVWSMTVRDFRHNAAPIQFGHYEPQRAVEISKMSLTIEGKPKRSKKRVNELHHITDVTPVPEYSQSTLFERIQS
jgi:hypothetical protein